VHKVGTLADRGPSASIAPADEEAPIPDARRIPEATVVRLPLYYRALLETADQEIGTVSSERLAELAGVNAAKVRKDLSYLGSYGTRGVGYDVEHLLH
jgi:redox-sensing transcriptional repressor